MSLDVVAGIGGVVRTGRWAPFIVTVDNRGPALEARLSLEVFRGSELRGTLASRLFQRDVELPARSRRRFTFAAPVVPAPRPAVVRVTAGTDGEPRELAHLEIDLRRLAVSDRLVVAVSSEIAFDFLAQEGARVVYPHAENLPDAWAGWSGVDLVVVRDTAFHRLGAAQVAALERWVQAGGTIVFTGGAAALQLAASGLAGLLPVEIAGLVETAALPSLGRLAGVAPPAGPAIVAGSVARDGATVLAAKHPARAPPGDAIPLVAVRRTGAGTTAWLAFDPADRAFGTWPGLPALWRAVAGDAAAIPADDDALREPLDDPWIAPLAARSDVSFPSHARLAIFLAAFLLPSLALLLLPRRLGSRLGPRLRAGLLLFLAAAASAAGWFAFNRWLFRGDDFLLEAARVEAGDGAARLSRRLAVCSPSGGGFELALGPVDSRIEDVSAVARGRSPDSLAVELGEATTVRSAVPGRFQSRLLIADSVIPFALSAVLETGRRRGAAHGGKPHGHGDPRRRFSSSRARSCRWATSLPDRRRSMTFPRSAAAGSTGGVVVIADVGRRAFWERESAAIDRAGPVLVGWLDEPPLAARLGGAPAAASVCMVTLEVAER